MKLWSRLKELIYVKCLKPDSKHVFALIKVIVIIILILHVKKLIS